LEFCHESDFFDGLPSLNTLSVVVLHSLTPCLQNNVDTKKRCGVTARDVQMIVETWHLCHDLLNHVKAIRKNSGKKE
jgi:hypothetical protein